MSNQTRLFTQPPSTIRGAGTHLASLSSLNTKAVRAVSIESESIITETLQNRAGDVIVDPEQILLDESPSQPTPPAGTGRFWVRNDTPNKLIFTNDAGTQTPLTPGLADALAIDSDAGNLVITNVSAIEFAGGIQIANATASATASSSTAIAVGEGAAASGANTVVIGRNSSAETAEAVVVGYDCNVVSVAPNSNGAGGIAIGSNIDSYGPGICIGKNLSNLGTGQDLGFNILIGKDIAVTDAATTRCVLIGDNVTPARSSGVVIGRDADGSESDFVIAIGFSSYAKDDNATAIGSTSSASAEQAVAIGSGSTASALRAVAIGANSSATGINAMAIGYSASAAEQGTAIGANSNALAPYSVAIGFSTTVANITHTYSAVVGANLTTRAANEFVTRGVRIVRAQLTTTSDTTFTILSYPTVASDVFHIEATVTGIRTGVPSATYMATYENFHFRNKAGTLSRSVTIGTKTEDTSDNSTGYESSLEAVGQNISLSVKGGVAPIEVFWTAVIRVYAGPV